MAIKRQVLTGDGDSHVFQVGGATPSSTSVENVGFQFGGSFNGATVTINTSMGGSPIDWEAEATTYTDTDADILNLPSGSLLKFTVSGSGSPIPNIRLTVNGDVK